jgi:hypothetical protein
LVAAVVAHTQLTITTVATAVLVVELLVTLLVQQALS